MTPAKNILEKQTIQRVENTPNVLPEFIPNSHKEKDEEVARRKYACRRVMKFVGKGEYDERFEEMKSMVEKNPNLLFVIIVDEGRNFAFFIYHVEIIILIFKFYSFIRIIDLSITSSKY